MKSFLKTISYRILGSLATISISFFMTGVISTSLKIGVMDIIIKSCIYYTHELIWNNYSKWIKTYKKRQEIIKKFKERYPYDIG